MIVTRVESIYQDCNIESIYNLSLITSTTQDYRWYLYCSGRSPVKETRTRQHLLVSESSDFRMSLRLILLFVQSLERTMLKRPSQMATCIWVTKTIVTTATPTTVTPLWTTRLKSWIGCWQDERLAKYAAKLVQAHGKPLPPLSPESNDNAESFPRWTSHNDTRQSTTMMMYARC